MSADEDKNILKLTASPDSRRLGFKLLVNTYQERVYNIVRRMVISHDDTNDIVQEVFIRVWKNLDGFRQESSLYTWIYRIAVNEALKHLKQKRFKMFLPLINVEEQLKNLIDSNLHFNGNQLQAKLQKAILTLPPKQRLVFNMKYFENHTYEEMSEILGTSVGALKASYHLAVKKIENHLDSI